MEFLEQIRDASHNRSMSLSEILWDGFPELEEDFDDFPVEEADVFAEIDDFLNSSFSSLSSLLSLSPETNNELRQLLEFVDSSSEELGMSRHWSESSGESDLRLSEPPGGESPGDLLPRLINAGRTCLVLTSTLISSILIEMLISHFLP